MPIYKVTLYTMFSVVCIYFCVQLVSCSKPHSHEQTRALVDSNGQIISTVSRDSTLRVATSNIEQLVDGNNTFAWDMYKTLSQINSDNIVFSPYSISVALAMTYAGAKKQTESEMKAALHFTLNQTILHSAFNSLDLELASRGRNAVGREGGKFTLQISNSLWGEISYSFLSSYCNEIATNYSAGLKLVDFIHNPEKSRQIINEFIKKETNDKIIDILAPQSISSLTKLIIVNAVYFDAAWKTPFLKEKTIPSVFIKQNNDSLLCPFMNLETRIPYFENKDLQAIEMPYSGKEISIVFVLPKNLNLKHFENIFNKESADNIINEMYECNVKLSLPKFTFQYGTISLVNALKAMGIATAFEENNANFSGMDGTKLLFISDVLHQGFISIDENGTTASAATLVQMLGRGIQSKQSTKKVISFNHPFLFFIRDIASKQILFIGRVANPDA